MMDPLNGFSRRRFLSGVAVLGVTPAYSRVAGWPLLGPSKKWTGDDFDEAHARQRNPYALLREIKERTEHPPCDVIVIGGGISGLTVAYKLRHRNVVLLERESQTGGVSKSENWNGIEYSLGAAYMVDPAPDGPEKLEEEGTEEEKENWALLNELGLLKEVHSAEEENSCVFTNTQVVPDLSVYSEENKAFFQTVADHDHFPEIPPRDMQLIKDLDTVSFKEFLKDSELQKRVYGTTVGAVSSAGLESIEYYFWGAFGTNTWETSAYHGLNFFAAEFTKLLIFPGGNAFIAKALEKQVRRDPKVIQTGHYVLLAEPLEGGRGYAVYALKGGEVHRYTAPAVVFAAPLFLAKTLIPSLPDEQKKLIESFDYRSFVVANVLLKRPKKAIFRSDDAKTEEERKRLREGYELRRIHEVDVERQDPYRLSTHGVFSDIVVADFVKDAPEYAILTVYRPYPYAHGRDRLRYLSYEFVEKEIRDAVIDAFSGHGLRESDIEDIRLTRWGHPMIIPRPGQLAEGIMKKASAPYKGLFFSHTDTLGAPAIENALFAARNAAEGVENLLERPSAAAHHEFARVAEL